MKTVKEISELTGGSVRTLHYNDEIGLLKPTDKNEAGYRFYDDQTLETLRQILFFREFDIPCSTGRKSRSSARSHWNVCRNLCGKALTRSSAARNSGSGTT